MNKLKSIVSNPFYWIILLWAVNILLYATVNSYQKEIYEFIYVAVIIVGFIFAIFETELFYDNTKLNKQRKSSLFDFESYLSDGNGKDLYSFLNNKSFKSFLNPVNLEYLNTLFLDNPYIVDKWYSEEEVKFESLTNSKRKFVYELLTDETIQDSEIIAMAEELYKTNKDTNNNWFIAEAMIVDQKIKEYLGKSL